MGKCGKLGMGKCGKLGMGVVKLKKGDHHVFRNNPVQQGFNIVEVVLCRQPDFYKKLIGAFFHISGIVILTAQRFKDVPKLGQGVGQFFVQPGKNTEPAILHGVSSFGRDTQDFFPTGQAKVSRCGDELIIQKIIHRRPCVFKLRLLGSGNPLKFRIIPDNIGKIID
nr:MAG TPA: hypothetical protein [Caudoviricetes sp.]